MGRCEKDQIPNVVENSISDIESTFYYKIKLQNLNINDYVELLDSNKCSMSKQYFQIFLQKMLCFHGVSNYESRHDIRKLRTLIKSAHERDFCTDVQLQHASGYLDDRDKKIIISTNYSEYEILADICRADYDAPVVVECIFNKLITQLPNLNFKIRDIARIKEHVESLVEKKLLLASTGNKLNNTLAGYIRNKERKNLPRP